MKVKKVITVVVAVILILVLLIVTVFGIYKDKAIKVAVEVGATKALNVAVTLDDASLSLFAGKLQLRGLNINNPPGFAHEKLLTMSLASVDVEVRSLMGETIEIEEMLLDDITLTIEQKGLKTNLQIILESLPETEKEEPAEAKKKPAKKLRVANLNITNVNVKVKLLPIPGKSDTITFVLPPIKMTNLGSGGEMTTAELSAKIFTAIAKGVAREGRDYLPDAIIGPLQDATEEAFKIGTEVLKQATEVGGEAADVLKKGLEGVGEGIKGIFGEKKKK